MVIGNCPVCGAEIRVGTDMTNADRIRNMTDEDMAEFLESIVQEANSGTAYIDFSQVIDDWLDWLKQEAD